MKIRLGYVAISVTLEEIDHYRTITWTTFSKLDSNKQNKVLDEIIRHNLSFLKRTLQYNLENEIYFYRLSQNIIPLATHPAYQYDYITPYKKEWQEIGQFIIDNNIRVDMHPDQFCVLNSINEKVVEQSTNILRFCYKIYQALGFSGKAILHVGSSYPEKNIAKERFIKNFYYLPKEIRQMIILENDDKVYTAKDVLELCEHLKIPMVLDYHHYLCNHQKEKITELLPRIYNTWNLEKLVPKMHFSTPKNFKEKRAHSTYISLKSFQKFLTVISTMDKDLDIMLECKAKDEALFRLVRQLKTYPNYLFLTNSTFKIKK